MAFRRTQHDVISLVEGHPFSSASVRGSVEQEESLFVHCGIDLTSMRTCCTRKVQLFLP